MLFLYLSSVVLLIRIVQLSVIFCGIRSEDCTHRFICVGCCEGMVVWMLLLSVLYVAVCVSACDVVCTVYEL